MATRPQELTPQAVKIVVPSTDAYVRLWRPFFLYLERYWPDRPFEVILGANTRQPFFSKATVLVTRPNLPWGSHFQALLEQVTDHYVLVIMPDYFLTDYTDTAAVLRAAELTYKPHVTSVRLVPSPHPRGNCSQGEFLAIKPTDLYSTSLVATIWRTRRLLRILQPDDTPWTFERQGSRRRDTSELLYSSSRALIHYDPAGALSRGRLTRDWRRRLEIDGQLDFLHDWPLMTRSQAVVLCVRNAVFNVLLNTSPSLLGSAYHALDRLQRPHASATFGHTRPTS